MLNMSSTKTFSLPICFSLILFSIVDSADLTVMKSCPGHCGGMEIPFPFGIGNGCYLDKWYEIECVKLNTSVSGKFVPFLSLIRKEVVDIFIPYMSSSYADNTVPYGSVRIRNRITSKGCSSGGEEEFESLLNLTGTPFYVSPSNRLVGVGCNNTASLTNVEPRVVGCKSSCRSTYRTPTKDYLASTVTCKAEEEHCRKTNIMRETKCNGIRCCKTKMLNTVRQIVGVRIEDTTIKGGCKVAFLSDQTDDLSNASDPQSFHANIYSTVQLGWFVRTLNHSFVKSLGCYDSNRDVKGTEHWNYNCACNYNSNLSYTRCSCTSGYVGNPYLPGGCKDIDDCLDKNPCGTIGTCLNTPGSYRCVYNRSSSHESFFHDVLENPFVILGIASIGSVIFICGMFWLYKFIRKQMSLRQKKKFIRNKCLLLEQQLTLTEGNLEKRRVFSSKELVKATENFCKNRILGEGGQGTVYKGMLADGRIVAVKKSKVVEEDKLEEFINEVVILSQINHRNIMKLLGCCLDVPVLVYEFIPNGNLSELLHDECDDNAVATWEVRLRIAEDVAGALAYMHSSASSQFYHRDVKSANIMLDEKYRPKVSDFGASKSVTEGHTHLTTAILGSPGYLDPEYHQSSQVTDKSDVYSFGVVLVELITGEESILRSQENRRLATHFILTMKENKLADIIDARIRDGCMVNQVTAVAKIARKCLNMKGRNRPTMREVSMELQRIRSSPGDMQPYEYISENEDNDEQDQEVLEINIGVE